MKDEPVRWRNQAATIAWENHGLLGLVLETGTYVGNLNIYDPSIEFIEREQPKYHKTPQEAAESEWAWILIALGAKPVPLPNSRQEAFDIVHVWCESHEVAASDILTANRMLPWLYSWLRALGRD